MFQTELIVCCALFVTIYWKLNYPTILFFFVLRTNQLNKCINTIVHSSFVCNATEQYGLFMLITLDLMICLDRVQFIFISFILYLVHFFIRFYRSHATRRLRASANHPQLAYILFSSLLQAIFFTINTAIFITIMNATSYKIEYNSIQWLQLDQDSKWFGLRLKCFHDSFSPMKRKKNRIAN